MVPSGAIDFVDKSTSNNNINNDKSAISTSNDNDNNCNEHNEKCIANNSPIIRNVCIIAHVDHGKTTTADILLAKSGRIQSSKAGETLLLDSGKAEAERGITISAKNVTLIYPKFVINRNYYIKNLPHHCDIGDVSQAFINYGMENAEIHPKRGYGYISLSGIIDPPESSIEIDKRIINIEPIKRSDNEKGIFIRDFRLNLIDSPGHSEFSSQVSSSLRICDGAILVVDAIEGVCTSTEILLRNACRQGVIPILLLNKADRLFLELNLDPNDAILRMQSIVNHINMILESETIKGNDNNIIINPFSFDNNDITGRIIISSGYFGWGTSILNLIEITKTDSFLSALKELGKIHKSIKKGNISIFRTAIENILKQSTKISNQTKETIMKYFNDSELDIGLTNSSQIEQQKQQLQTTYKKHLKRILSLVIPMSNSLLESIVTNLPSPFAAQAKRRIYPLFGLNILKNNNDDILEQDLLLLSKLQNDVSICSNNKNTSLVAHIAKGVVIPNSSSSSSSSSNGSNEVGWMTRVFSGILNCNENVRIITDYGEILNNIKIIHIYLFDGKHIESVPYLEAGNVGIIMIKIQTSKLSNQMLIVRPGEYILSNSNENDKNTTIKEISTYPFVPIPHEAHSSVAAALRLTAQTNTAKMQRKIMDSLEILSRIDPAMSFYVDNETKDLIVSGSGELHLEVIIDSIKEMIGSDIIELGEPVVALREIATKEGKIPKLSKSTNKLNNVSVIAVPLDIFSISISSKSNDEQKNDSKAVKSIEDYDLYLQELESAPDFKSKCAVLSDKFGWSSSEIKKIWAFGPEQSLSNEGTCILMNSTISMQNIGDIQDSSKNAFQKVTSNGIISDSATTAASSSSSKKKKSKLRGVVFRIVDAKVHTDSAHRRPQQIEPMVSEAIRESFLDCDPVIVEPMYRAKISCCMPALKQVQRILESRNAKIISVTTNSYSNETSENESLTEQDFIVVECDISISKSFGLVKELSVTARGSASRKPLVTYEKGGWISTQQNMS